MKKYLSFSLTTLLSFFLAITFYGCNGGGGTTAVGPGVTIDDQGGVAVDETGPTSDTYTVVLNTEPSDDVVVTVTSTDTTTGVTVDLSNLTFTGGSSGNWNVPQTVTVTAVDDAAIEGAHSSTISHSASSTDTNYNGISISNVTANITDNDTSGVDISESGGSTDVTEDGQTDTYTVVLNSQPTAGVTVTVTATDTTTGVTVDQGSLSFTTSDWDQPQTVTVTAVDDGIHETSPHTTTVTHASSSSDPDFNGIGINDVTASITDNDRFLYTANANPGGANGSVSGFTINPSTGELTAIGSAVAAGPEPRSVAVNPAGTFLYVANRNPSVANGGSVSAYSIDSSTGALTELSGLGSPFATGGDEPRSLTVDPTGSFLYVANQGSDDVSAFTINTDGSLTATTPASFSTGANTGPRSVAAEPVNGSFLYVALAATNQLTGFTIAQDGTLSTISTVGTGTAPREVTVDPFGAFAYVGCTGPDTVSGYSINPLTGALSELTGSPFATVGGSDPRKVVVTPDGQFAYVTLGSGGTDDIFAYSVGTDGSLSALTPSTYNNNAILPVHAAVDPSGKYLFAPNANSDDISAYTITTTTGALTKIAGPNSNGNFDAGREPVSTAITP